MQIRVPYLDYLKIIAIFLVVFCHFVLLSETIPANLWMCASLSAVPVFFMVNGALLFARPWNLQKHLYKTGSVYLVLVVWKLIYLVTVPPMLTASAAGASFGSQEILRYLFLFEELGIVNNGHLWFMDALLCVYLVFPILRPFFSRRRLIWIAAFAGLFFTCGLHSLGIWEDMLRSAGFSLPVSFAQLRGLRPMGTYGNMLGFFLLGGLLGNPAIPDTIAHHPAEYDRRCPAAIRSILCLSGFLIGLITLWLTKWFLSGQPAWNGVPITDAYLHVPVIVMAVSMFLLFRDLPFAKRELPLFRFVSSHTLGIFYLHWFWGWLLINPIAAFLVSHGIAFGVGINLLKNLLLIGLSLLTCLILRKIPFACRLIQ